MRSLTIYRRRILLVGFLAAITFSLTIQVLGQTSQSVTPTTRVRAAPAQAPRTPWGDPDLQGLWDFSSVVPFERPAELADKPTLTGEEAAKFAEQLRSRSDRDNRALDAPGRMITDFNEFWTERGPAGDNRTSLIIDPPNGRLPPLTPEARKRNEAVAAARRGVGMHEPTPGGWIDEIGPGSQQVRCLVGVNSGPPMRPSAYNNHVRILQIPGYAVLVTEQIHDARVVPLDGRPHGRLRQWAGDSRGRWDGDTLVIDTINFRGPTILGSASMHLVERFTRVDDSTVLYRHTVDDPDEWTRPWTAELIMKRTENQMYEFACHEGNYGLVNILKGARARDATP